MKRSHRYSVSNEQALCSSWSSGVSLRNGRFFIPHERRKKANSTISASSPMAGMLSLSNSSKSQMCASGAAGTIHPSHPCMRFLHGVDTHSMGWFPLKSVKCCNESLHTPQYMRRGYKRRDTQRDRSYTPSSPLVYTRRSRSDTPFSDSFW